MLTQRQKNIIFFLVKSAKPVTARWIAKQLGVSDRTIRKELKDVQRESSSLGFELNLIRGKGYQIQIKDEELFNREFNVLIDDGNGPLYTDFTVQNNRVMYLLKQFLLDNGYIKLEVFEEKMFVSKSTIQNDLKEVRKILEYYHLELLNRPHYGLYIHGDEYRKRLCLANYIHNQQTGLDSNRDQLPIFKVEVYKKIHSIIIGKVNHYKIEISDISLENLATHITIACKRIEQGFLIDYIEGNLLEEFSFEKIVAKEIVREVEVSTGLIFPDTEINYIVIHLVGTKLIHKESLTAYSKLDEVESIMSCMLYRLKKEMNWDFYHDHEFIQAMILHLRPAMNRLRYKMNIRNPLLQDIKFKYPLAFEGAVIASKCMKEYLAMDIGEHEMAYLALHIGVALERMKSKDKKVKRIILVCASGVGSAKLLYYRLENIFEQALEIVDTINYYRLEAYDLSSIDFIISTVPIKEEGIPVQLVSTFLEDSDIREIRKHLSVATEMNDNYLDSRRIFLKQDLHTREDVIHFLCDNLYKQNLVTEGYEELVLERENSAPTSFGNLVAIPHPSIPVTNETFWTICILKRPIAWSNNQMVQLVCLLNISATKKGELDKMYRKLIAIMEDQELVQQLINCDQVEEIIRLLN
ncbi:transcription antiterminator [Niallia sp. JL1B1071]|uniref:BglG family transcription antiterminator n=1 Tax=Niallia tiangongensis TaxID=3237105 RepID=UPI0037DD376B